MLILTLAASGMIVYVLREKSANSPVTILSKQAADAPPEETTETLEAPVADVFEKHRVDMSNNLNNELDQSLTKSLRDVLRKNNCKNQYVELYEKSGIPEKLLVTDCFRMVSTASQNAEAIRELEYPIMFALMKGRLHELSNLNDFAFMYESGTLKAVTSLKRDGNLQLWLDGYVCENDGEPETVPQGGKPEPVTDCRGTRVVEINNGQLLDYQP